MKKEEIIYGLATGVLIPEEVSNIQLREAIKDEFDVGTSCGKWYDQICKLKNKLAERLGKEEDKDIEQILDMHTKICEYLAYKMFEYGKLYGKEKICE